MSSVSPLERSAEPRSAKRAFLRSRRLLGSVLLGCIALLLAGHWPAPSLPEGAVADRVELVKHRRMLRLYAGDVVLAEYGVALGAEPEGHKQQEGDERTPEGSYLLDDRNGDSAFYRSMHVSYPSVADRERAAIAGIDPGGMIMVHGLPNRLGWIGQLHRLVDWTDGCIAVTNREMDEIWRAVPDGTPIEVTP